MGEVREASNGRWLGVGAILCVGWLLFVLGVMGVYMHRSLYNEAVFSKRVAAVLDQPGVQRAVATQLTDVVIKQVPDAVIARPLIQSVVELVVAEPAFQKLVLVSLGKFHSILLNPETANIVFTIEGAPQLIEQTLRPFDQKLAVSIGNATSAQLARIPNPGPAFRLIQLGSNLGPAAWVVGLLGLGLMAIAALTAPSRRRGAITALVVLALAGLGIVFILGLVRIGLGAATVNDPVLSDAAAGIFEGLFGDLRRIGYVIAAIGVVAAAVFWSLRFTLPVAASAGARALEGASEAGHAAMGAAGNALADAGSTAAERAQSTSRVLRQRELQAQDLTVAALGGVRRLLVPAKSKQGLILQGVVALGISAAVLFAWATVVDVVVLALGLGLAALALNRILIVLVAWRGQRLLTAGPPPVVDSPTDA